MINEKEYMNWKYRAHLADCFRQLGKIKEAKYVMSSSTISRYLDIILSSGNNELTESIHAIGFHGGIQLCA